jgi:hypothetical protein
MQQYCRVSYLLGMMQGDWLEWCNGSYLMMPTRMRQYCNSQQFWVPCLPAITPAANNYRNCSCSRNVYTNFDGSWIIAAANLTDINKMLCLCDSITSNTWFVSSFILLCDLTTSHNVVHKSFSLTILSVMTAFALIIHCTNYYMDFLNKSFERTRGAYLLLQ